VDSTPETGTRVRVRLSQAPAPGERDEREVKEQVA
jgi:hypothetical protein